MREPPSPDFEETLGDVSAEREREKGNGEEETANARERKLRENRDG